LNSTLQEEAPTEESDWKSNESLSDSDSAMQSEDESSFFQRDSVTQEEREEMARMYMGLKQDELQSNS
jgi:hypothetical protein